MKAKGKRTSKPLGEGESLQQLNLDATGFDRSAEEIYACVPAGRAQETVRRCQSFSADLSALAEWLSAGGVTTVAMESTGVDWIPVYEILAAAGFELDLLNARHSKNVTGRRSDVLDCQWMQPLQTDGLRRGSFRPDEAVCGLRKLIRQRAMLISYWSSHIQHRQKAWEQMNLKLTTVVSANTGETGLTILRAILAGERNPPTLAAYRHPGCAHSEPEIAKALDGNYRAEHRFTLQQAVALDDFYTRQSQRCDEVIAAKYRAFTPPTALEQTPLPPPRVCERPGKGNTPTFDRRRHRYPITGVDLTQIDGVNVLTAQKLISEIGLDMSKWPTVKHFTFWLTLCPTNQIAGGKIIRRTRKKIHNRTAQALAMAAQSRHRSQSALGAFYRRMRAKHGSQKANVAAAPKLARIIYFMVKNKTPFHDLAADHYEQQQRQRQIRNWHQQAARLGFSLEPAALDALDALVSYRQII